MSAKWFVQIDDRVEGPFRLEELKSKVDAGQLAAHDLVWGPGLEHWRQVSWWSGQSHSSHGGESTTSTMTALKDIWHFALAGESHGPFNREILVQRLSKVNSLENVLLWTKGMKEWAPIFEFHDILASLGVNKRQFPRGDIDGQVTIRPTTGGTLVAPALSVSEGGMGVVLDEGFLTAGQLVSLELVSSVFRAPMTAKAEVRYVAGGVCGLRFTSISSESKSALISYVRQSQTRFVLKAS